MTKLSKDAAWKIYETLPADLKQAIFSEETANSILSACQRNGLTEQQTSQVAELVGYYLLGVLPIENLAQEIINATSATSPQASQILTELNRLVFHSIQNSLDGLYNLKTEKSVTPSPQPKAEGPTATPQPAPEPKPEINQAAPESTEPATPDTYREAVE